VNVTGKSCQSLELFANYEDDSDTTDELLTVTGLFTHFFSLDTTIPERKFFQRLAQLIGTRSARLSACGIAAIVSKMGYLEEVCDILSGVRRMALIPLCAIGMRCGD
jgi:hexokinase